MALSRRFRRLLVICLYAGLVWFPTAAVAEGVTVLRVSNRSVADEAGKPDYFHDLLQRILDETTPAFGPVRIERVTEKLSQARQIAEVQAGRLDLLWTGTNIDREQTIRAIRIPVDMGLIGQRLPVIRADRRAEFAAVRSVDDLRRFKACQGAHWPDADILDAAGLPQEIHAHFDQLYLMLRAGRCDYFLRGVAEVAGEMAIYGGSDLIAFDRLVVAYPMPIYLFVAKDNEKLAKRLETGLRALLSSGAMRQMLATHPSTRAAFPLERFKDATILRLRNPTLPVTTPLHDPSLWLELGNGQPGATGRS